MLNTLDERLLEFLKENSRISYADLGRKLSLSPSAVRERVQKMEDIGVISKFTIQIDNKKLGNDLEAFILLKVFQGQLKNIIAKAREFPEVQEAYRITGNQNIYLKVVIKNQLGLQRLLDKLNIYGDTTTFIVLSEINPGKKEN